MVLSEHFSCWLSIPAHHRAPIRLHTGQLTRGLAEGSAASPVQPEQPRSCPQPTRGAHLVLSTQHPRVVEGTGPRDASVQLELDKMRVAAGLRGAEEGLGIRSGDRERERERKMSAPALEVQSVPAPTATSPSLLVSAGTELRCPEFRLLLAVGAQDQWPPPAPSSSCTVFSSS